MSRTVLVSSPLLTPRDIQILIMAYQYDSVTIEMLWRRFWGHSMSQRACYARVQRLISSGYFRSCILPSKSGKGTGKQWLTVGPAAVPILVEYLDLDPSEIKQLRHSLPPFYWQHDLA